MSAIALSGVEKALAMIAGLPKQVRFATAQAINTTLKNDVQRHTLEQLLPSKFTLRSKGQPWQKPGGRFGFNIRPFANRENLTATLGSQADWLKHQEHAGVKRSGHHRIAIPTTFWKRREELMTRAKKPAALLKEYRRARQAEAAAVAQGAKARSARRRRAATVAANNARKRAATISSLAHTPFLYEGDRMGGAGIFVRTGDERLPIKRLFKFVDSADIDQALEFERTAAATVNQRFDRNFQVALARALATSK